MPKGTFQAEVMLNSKKIKPIALAVKAITCYYPNQHFLLSAKIKGGHWKVHEKYIIHTAVCQKTPFGLSSSKRIKPIALAIILV